MVKHQLEYCESFVTKSTGKKTTKGISYFFTKPKALYD